MTFSSTVKTLPYKFMKSEVIEFQEGRDEEAFEPTYIEGNRFYLGYTAYFDGSMKLRDDYEVCKAILPDIHQWLIDHAPNAVIEMGEWNVDGPDPEDIDPEDRDEDWGGDASVWVNFGSDNANAITFSLMFSERKSKRVGSDHLT